MTSLCADTSIYQEARSPACAAHRQRRVGKGLSAERHAPVVATDAEHCPTSGEGGNGIQDSAIARKAK